MRRAIPILRTEIAPMLRLAGPVVLAEIGWVMMGIVDTIMVGRLGPVEIGAVGLGSILFIAVAIFGMGLLLGLDTLVAQSFGAGRLDECHRWLLHGVALSLFLAAPLTAAAWLGTDALSLLDFDPAVLALTRSYLHIVIWSLLPLLLYASFRRYLQALGFVQPVMFALISANVINALVNWVLIFGRAGFAALGTDGAAWATVVSRIYLAVFLFGSVVLYDARQRGQLAQVSRRIEGARLLRLVRLGLPAATQVTLEMGVFAAAGALAARLDPVSLASHQLVLHMASFTFMVPLGLASAGAVRVGHAIGRRDAVGASCAGWTALFLGVTFMSAASLAFVGLPGPLLRLFTDSSAVVRTGTSILLIAALFQPFDGAQGVATGVLRGAGNTRTPMAANLAAHWLVGLPTGYVLCFSAGVGVTGLWAGLGLGLVAVAVVLLAVWRRTERHLRWQF
ncbi:MAG: MATE family efflux transporter [Vicinamibacterales bacterium]